MPKFGVGPWKAIGHCVYRDQAGSAQLIATVAANLGTTGVEDDIARFLAKAPAMYRAISLILALHDHPDAHVPGYQLKLDPKAEEQLRSAIEGLEASAKICALVDPMDLSSMSPEEGYEDIRTQLVGLLELDSEDSGSAPAR